MSYDPVFSLTIVEHATKSIFVGHESGSIRQYHLRNLDGIPIATLEGHTGCVTAFILPQSDEAELYSVSIDKTIRLWAIEEEDYVADSIGITAVAGTVKKTRSLKTISTDSGIRCGVFCGDSLRCGGSDGCIYTLREDNSVERWTGHKDVVSCMASSRENLLVSGSYDNQLRIWDTATGKCLFVLMDHTNHVKCVSFVNEMNVIMSLGRDETLRLWMFPEPLEDEDNVYDAAVEDDNMDADRDPPSDNSAPTKVPQIVHCCSILKLPSDPLCLEKQNEENHSNPLTYIGASGGDIYAIAADKYYNIVKSYLTRNKHDVKEEMRRLKRDLRATVAKAKQIYKKSVKATKNRLKNDQKEEKRKEAASLKNRRREEAAEAKLRMQEDAGESDTDVDDENENEDDDEVEEEDETMEDDDTDNDEEDEEGEEMEREKPVSKYPFTEERLTELIEFTAEAKKKMETAIEKAESAVSENSKKLRPLAETKYEKNDEQFYSLPFIRVFKQKRSEESVTAIAVDGFDVFVPSGKTKGGTGVVLRRNCTPGHEF